MSNEYELTEQDLNHRYIAPDGLYLCRGRVLGCQNKVLRNQCYCTACLDSYDQGSLLLQAERHVVGQEAVKKEQYYRYDFEHRCEEQFFKLYCAKYEIRSDLL